MYITLVLNKLFKVTVLIDFSDEDYWAAMPGYSTVRTCRGAVDTVVEQLEQFSFAEKSMYTTIKKKEGDICVGNWADAYNLLPYSSYKTSKNVLCGFRR